MHVRVVARCAGVLGVTGAVAVLAAVVLTFVDRDEGPVDAVGSRLYVVGVGALVLGIALALAPRRIDVPPLVVMSPVAGRWSALNSPTTRVPSHGIHSYGQTYAVDLVHDPVGVGRPVFGKGPPMRPPTDYPGFGAPVHAPVDGVVVRAVDRYRDHRSRTTGLSLVYLFLEGAVREIGGPGPILGNHLVLHADDGSYVLMAHLRRGSLTVRTGERVDVGRRVAECGNSGNSSEPHVHLQRMDHRRPLLAVGLPLAVRGGAADGGDGLPANGEVLEGRPAA